MNLPKRVPVLAKPQEGSSMAKLSRAERARSRARLSIMVMVYHIAWRHDCVAAWGAVDELLRFHRSQPARRRRIGSDIHGAGSYDHSSNPGCTLVRTGTAIADLRRFWNRGQGMLYGGRWQRRLVGGRQLRSELGQRAG